MNKLTPFRFGFTLLTSALVAGCLNLKQPAPPGLGPAQVPAHWASEGNTNPVLDDWIASFGDEQLVHLVNEAITNNANLAVTAARLDQAIASAGAARANLWPQLSGSLNAQNTTLIKRTDAEKAGGVKANTTLYGASLDLSWEVDVWGRLRYASRSAADAAAASAADYAAARRSLAAQVAKAWFAAAEAKLQYQLKDNFVSSYEETLRIVEAKFKAGAVSEQDVANAKADLASARRLAEAAATTLKEAVRSLEVLLGRYPAAELAVADDLQAVPPAIPTGLPSQLLERRADIIAAERRVAAAFNTTEAAKAARLPQISLTSNLGSGSTELKDLVDPKNMALNFAGNLFAPLFDAGLRQSQVELAQAQQREAMASYRDTALTAFQEVENLLVSGTSLAVQEEQLREAVTQYETTRRIAETRYKAGSISLTDVLVIQRQELQAKSNLLILRDQRLTQRVNLHLALGGDFAKLEQVAQNPH